MPTYIVLGNFTDQGIRSIRDSLKREDAFRTQCEKVGAKVADVYRTMGRYDLAAIVDAPARPITRCDQASRSGRSGR